MNTSSSLSIGIYAGGIVTSLGKSPTDLTPTN
jgi:hypothetical protein